MARSGLTKSQVREVRDRLLAEGGYPSADAVRRALGDTGSKSTIHKYLKELEGEDAGTGLQRADTERALQALIAQVAEQLHLEAERHMRKLHAQQEQALRDKDRELAELRDTVALLTARLEKLEGAPLADEPSGQVRERAIPRRSPAMDGLGNFGVLMSNSRCGSRDISPFSSVLTSARSDAFEVDDLWPLK